MRRARMAELTREGVPEAVAKAISDKLARLEALRDKDREERWKRVEELQRQIAEAPKHDSRSASEIMADLYDEHGLPK